jgi:ABC-2 type transport system permease protein
MTRALLAEWTKLWSVGSTRWTLVGTFASMVLLGVLLCAGTETSGCGGGECEDMVMLALGGVYLAQFAVVALGVLAITSEYATGQIRVTFVADPRRRRVLVAKALVLAAVVFVVSLAASLASYVIGHALLVGNGFTPEHGYPAASLTDGPVLRAIAGTALYLSGLALLSLGLAAVLRHTAAAISILIALLWLPLILASFMSATAPYDVLVLRVTPMAPGISIQRTIERTDNLPIGEWAGLGVSGLWALGAMAAALWLIARRDA